MQIIIKDEKIFSNFIYRSKWKVAHECIVDTRPFKETCNVTVDDISKD